MSKTASILIVVCILLSGATCLNILLSVQAATDQAQDAVILSDPNLCYPICDPYPYETVLVQNTQTYSVTVVVFLVVHNSIMQTMYIGTSTVTVSGGENLTADVIFLLSSGNYTATMFAWYPDGSPASTALRNISINTGNL